MTAAVTAPGRLWIMVAGPYASGGASPQQRAENLRALNRAALAVLDAGHLPLVGVNMALPLVEAAGGRYDEIMLPVSLALIERCDACLRVGGASDGADAEVARFRAAGKPVLANLAELPPG